MHSLRLALVFSAFAAPAFAEVPDPCTLISMDEANNFTAAPATRTRTLTTGAWKDCSYLDHKQQAVITVQVREAKLPKAELDQEAESLQKIYRTTVKPVEVGDGGFWLTSRQELYFRKGHNIVRVVVPNPTVKSAEVNSQSVARLIETRIK